MSDQSTAFIGLGANLGERAITIERALALLRAAQNIRVMAVSSFHETQPVGGPPNQPLYLNAAAELNTSLRPRELLDTMLELERRLGRDRSSPERNLPRAIDLDVLFYGAEKIDEPGLIVPHPRLHEREFVLGPLNEIAPQWLHPVLKKSVAQLMRELQLRQ